jgi:hypothetical protein
MLRFALLARGQTAVTNALRTTAAKAPRRMQNITYDWAQLHVVRRLVVKEYPPPRPKQRYKRTHRLQARWYADPEGNTVRIGNRQPSAGYVVGDSKGKGQAWFHKGRWWLARTEIDKAKPELKKMVTAELNRMLRVDSRA